MKINPIDPMGPIEKTNRTSSIEKKPVKTDGIEDQVSISGEAKAIERAIQTAKDADVDETARVDALRQQIQNNEYSVDAANIAGKIVDTAAGTDGEV